MIPYDTCLIWLVENYFTHNKNNRILESNMLVNAMTHELYLDTSKVLLCNLLHWIDFLYVPSILLCVTFFIILNGDKNNFLTRMHSSRMRTVRYSGRLEGGVSRGCLPGECLPRGVSGWEAGGCVSRGVCLGGGCPGGVHLPPRGKNDRCLWKHNLYATIVADDNQCDLEMNNSRVIRFSSVTR